MALSDKERRQIDMDARLDHQDGTSRSYKGDVLTDVVFAPLDLLTGTPSTSERAAEKTEYYNDVKESLDRRK